MNNQEYYNKKIQFYNEHKLNEFGNPIILNIVEKNSTVFDIGCNTGNLARGLSEKKNCKVYGCDISPKALGTAKNFLENGKVIDLENFDKFPFIEMSFDYVVLADVLEHIKNPQEVLEKIKAQINFKYLVISLPNIAFFKVRFNSFFGKFDYTNSGIMDESHLHFYTLKTTNELITNSGYRVEKIIPFPLTNRKLAFLTHPLTNLFSTFFARQFVFLCLIK